MKPQPDRNGAAAGESKAGFVQALFGRIAPRYDLMNELVSLGQVRFWRRAAVRAMELAPASRVLDVGAGTGELARSMARGNPRIGVIALDFSEEMLRVGERRLERVGLSGRVHPAVGDALVLPFAEGAFDRVASAFVLRNVADLERTLAEMYRVVRPGGMMVSLEFRRLDWPVVGRLFDWYVGKAVPLLGGLLTGARWAYDYLLPSMKGFPSPEGVRELMEKAGFRSVWARPIFPGLVMLYVGTK